MPRRPKTDRVATVPIAVDQRLRDVLEEIGTNGVCRQMVAWVQDGTEMNELQAIDFIGLRGSAIAAVAKTYRVPRTR